MLDFASLLVAIGFSTAFLAAILLAAWKTTRRDGFLFSCAAGALLIAVSVGFSTIDSISPSLWAQSLGLGLLLAGEAYLYGSAAQFRLGTSPSRRIAVATVASVVPLLLSLLAGYNGLAYSVSYIASAILLYLVAYEFWRARTEAPMTAIGIAVLYFLVGLSFLPRALLVLTWDGLIVAGPPRNWAQDLSLMLIIGAIPALGAMTMALSQIRTTQAHRREALTDPLTGLLNRRALFETLENGLPPSGVAVLFDIDEFKAINDTHGHAMGDRVITLFAETLLQDLPADASAARIGGEEFALILRDTTMDQALRRAEDVRARFIARVRGATRLDCTVSAGLAPGGRDHANIDRVLAEADRALYEAKRGGRNRVVAARQQANSGAPPSGAAPASSGADDTTEPIPSPLA